MVKNIKKAAVIAAATLAMNVPGHAQSVQTSDRKSDKTEQGVDAAARRTVGSIVKYETVPMLIPGKYFVEYHIDEDGDGRVDVVRRRVIHDGEAVPGMHNPFEIVEIIEVYDSKNHMWNIIKEKVVGSRKPKSVPVYVPNEKVR